MIEIYLIRHGQTLWNKEKRMQGSLNSNLTEEGYNQAKLLKDHLQLVPFDTIVSSDIERAIITSSLIFEGKQVLISKALREIAMGTWEGKTYATIMSEQPEQWTNFFIAPDLYVPSDGGESFDDLRKRLKTFVRKELKNKDNCRIAFVSHRITIKMLISILMDDPRMFSQIDLDPTSYTVIQINEGETELISINNTSHYNEEVSL